MVLTFKTVNMKLNIITANPEQVRATLKSMYPQAHVSHNEINPDIHDFEITCDAELAVYPLEGLFELVSSYRIPAYNIRIY